MAIIQPPQLFCLVSVALFSLHASAGESTLKLKDDAASAAVVAQCSICHSLDYIQMNSRFMRAEGWQAEVRKMAKVMGAPIAESDIPALVDYLTRQYGVQ
jgi:sulfite dehydrogenase (cytochrome) subunit B